MATPRWRRLADRLAQEIGDGSYPPGSSLPAISDLVAAGEGSKATVGQAYRKLAEDGYVVVTKRRGTIVRDRSVIRVPVSRYSKVLAPGGTRGPWQTATAEQGLDGTMKMISIDLTEAPQDVAEKLDLPPGNRMVVCRYRHAMLGEDVIQIQRAWYPADLAVAAGLDLPTRIEGGVFGAMNGAGMLPKSADERITARKPTTEEAAELSIGTGVPVLLVERVAHDEDGRPVELLRVIGAADRIELVYSDLPIGGLT